MNSTFFDFKAEGLFPYPFPLLGYILIFGSILSLIATITAFPVLLFLGLVIISGRRGIEFHLSENKIREYYSFFYFLKIGKKDSLKGVEKIFINSTRVSQKVNTMVTTGITTRNTEFNAYLKLRNGETYFLTSGRNKSKLLNKLYPLESFLQTQIFDHTENIL